MNKVLSVAAILALAAAENRFLTKQKNIPNLPVQQKVAYDNEMVYYKNPKDYPKETNHGWFTDTFRDDELLLEAANDNELVWYPRGSEPIHPRDPFRIHQSADDELFLEAANDNELVYDPPGTEPKRPRNPFMIGQSADDELFVIEEMVWYPPGTEPKRNLDYRKNHLSPQSVRLQDDELMMRIDPSELGPHRRTFSPLVNSIHDDEQMIRLDPREWQGFKNYDDDELMMRIDPSELRPHLHNFSPLVNSVHDDEQMIRLDPREWQGFKTYDDDELFNAEQVEGKVKKFKDTLSKHTETIKQAQKDVKNLAGILKKLTQEQKNGVQNDNFPLLGQLIKEGRTLANEVKAQRTQKKPEVHDNNLFIEDVQDNDLSFKDKVKGAVNWVGDHPQVISEGAKAIKTLRGGK